MKKTEEKSGFKHLQTSSKSRPLPLHGMRPYARSVWKRILDSHKPDHFKPCSFEQLRVFCEVCASLKVALSAINREGEILTQSNGVVKRNPWCLERDACITLM